MRLKDLSKAVNPIFEPRPGDTSLDELVLDADRIPGLWKFLATASNWCMLAGFISLPSAFDDDDSRFKLSKTALSAISFTLLVVGYVLTGLVCWRQKNPLFQHGQVFMPGFSSSLLGLLSSLFNVYGNVPTAWSSTSIGAVTVSGVFTVFYGVISIPAGRRIDRIRESDRQRKEAEERAYEEEMQISEEERVRRKLLALMPMERYSPGGVPAGEEVPAPAGRVVWSANVGVIDGSTVRWPENAMLAENLEAERIRRETEENIAADLGPAAVSMESVEREDAERIRREREARRREFETREEEGTGLGLPPGLRRQYSEVQLSATLAGGPVGDEWIP